MDAFEAEVRLLVSAGNLTATLGNSLIREANAIIAAT
jgi:hypothetical protein